jgi:predicted phage terminase large subunit-like protein
MGALAPSILVDAVRREQKRRAAEASLHEFMKQAWHIVEPGAEFVDGWHLEVICEHLEGFINGEIRKLVLNMPPRAAKSLLCAVFAPVWAWIADPTEQWMFASYAAVLSIRDSVKCRRLIQSEWFQERWGHRFHLSGDTNVKSYFSNDKQGFRFATSTGAATTGFGANRIVVDDGHNSLDAQSDTIRQSVLDWFDGALSTRLNNPKTGCFLVVQQRLHERDLAGMLLERDGWDHLILPMRYEGRRVISSVTKQEDPRTVEGSLLWPERFGETEVVGLELALGEYGSAGQLQQRPAPIGGGILRTGHVQKWPHDKELPQFDFVIQSYDTAFTEKTSGDPSACQVWGAAKVEGKQVAILLDAFAERLSYPALKKRVIEEWDSRYGESGRRADLILVEQKASGQSIIQDLRQAGIPVRGYNPGRADKITRAHAVAPILETDCIYIPESKAEPGQFVKWARSFMKELELFPAARHDDQVDCFTQSVIYLKDAGWLVTLSYEDSEQDTEQDYSRHNKQNPYGA